MDSNNIIMVLIVAAGFVLIFSPYIFYRIKGKRYKNYYNTVFLKEENLRGPYQTDVSLELDSDNLAKAGFSADFTGYSILVKEEENVLHFNYSNSPQIELLEIEYTPEYKNVKSGNVTKIGDNYIDDTSTRRQEVASYGLLTFKIINDNHKFILKALLNKEIYMKLKSDFLTIN